MGGKRSINLDEAPNFWAVLNRMLIIYEICIFKNSLKNYIIICPVIPKYLIVPNEYVFQRNSTDTHIKLKNLLILRLNVRSEK